MQKQPNILLIVSDQFRGDAMGIAGHPDCKTPYLDTLASKGIIFDKAYSACPSCIAARAGLLTGLSQEHHKRVGYQDSVRWDYEKTMPGELAKAGYYTKCVGKMHVHPSRSLQGFHHIELHDGFLHALRAQNSVTYQESQKNSDDYFHYLRQELGINADTTDTGLECNSWVARPWCYEEKYHPTNWVTDRTIDFFRTRDTDKPFFLMASYLKPHPPLDPPQYYFDMYMNMKLRAPALGNWESDEALQQKGRIFDSNTGPIDPFFIQQMLAGYYGLITHLDHQIGRLMQALFEFNLDKNTIIIFTSDHGEELGDHHLFRKSRAYEGSSHIPLIIKAPENLIDGSKPGSRSQSIVELRDIMPTVLDIAGAKYDDLDGDSLIKICKDPKLSIREYLHGEHSYGELSSHWIVTPQDKYIWNTETGKEEFFDLLNDKRECNKNNSLSEDRKNLLRSWLINELKNREENFVQNNKLVKGCNYPPVLKK